MTFGSWWQRRKLFNRLGRLAHSDKVSSAALGAGYKHHKHIYVGIPQAACSHATRCLPAERLKQSP
jgi:hypothetical protein